MGKLTPEMSDTQIAHLMGEGNPGAMKLVLDILYKGAIHDPQSWAGGLPFIWDLDEMGMYGRVLYEFYTDVCQSELGFFLLVLRCKQMGILYVDSFQQAVKAGRHHTLDLNRLWNKLHEQLPSFRLHLEGP